MAASQGDSTTPTGPEGFKAAGHLAGGMDEGAIVPPRERECELCGRRDRWDEEVGNWRIEREGERRRAGNPYCLHEWDINGSYNPVPGEHRAEDD